MTSLENKNIRVEIDESARITVIDKRINHVWKQVKINGHKVKNINKTPDGFKIDIDYLLPEFDKYLQMKVNIKLFKNLPELEIEIESDENAKINEIYYPFPFVLEKGFLMIPHCEGVFYPVDDPAISEMKFRVYENCGLSMPFFGTTDLKKGYIGIIETPYDASVQLTEIPYQNSRVKIIYPSWNSTKGRFGYKRKILYHFSSEGGYVSLVKRYRQYVFQIGLFKSLIDKRKENPSVDLLIGAADWWPYGYHHRITPDEVKLKICKSLKESGVKKVVVGQSGKIAGKIKEFGYLASKYDCWTDLYPLHCERAYDKLAYPGCLLRLEDDSLMEAWIMRKDEGLFRGYKSCSLAILDLAKEKIKEDIEENKYNTRFIDVATAGPLLECWNETHPMDKRCDKESRYELLDFISKMKIVVGSEHGQDWAIPVIHYFEGMMSIWGWRYENLLPGAGVELLNYIRPHENYIKYNMNEKFRVPLFELVYHDAVVSTWYWGDSSNRLPEFWRKKDLFNILYGTMPMWLFDESIYESNKQLFIKSYNDVCKLTEKVGYDEMLEHKFLNSERDVQSTEFSSGIKVIVNFGKRDFTVDEKRIEPLGYLILS